MSSSAPGKRAGPQGTMDRFAKARKASDSDAFSVPSPAFSSAVSTCGAAPPYASNPSTPSHRSGATSVDAGFTGASRRSAPVTRSATREAHRHLQLLLRCSVVASSSFVFRAFVARLQTISCLPYDCACPVAPGPGSSTRMHDPGCHHASLGTGALEQSLASTFELIRRAAVEPEDVREEHLLCSIWILGLFEHSRIEGKTLRGLVFASLEGIPAGVLAANDLSVTSSALDRMVDRVIRLQPDFLYGISYRCWIPGPMADAIAQRVEAELKGVSISAWNDLVCSITKMATLQLGLASGWPSFPLMSPPRRGAAPHPASPALGMPVWPTYHGGPSASSRAPALRAPPLGAVALGVPAGAPFFAPPWDLLCDSDSDSEDVQSTA